MKGVKILIAIWLIFLLTLNAAIAQQLQIEVVQLHNKTAKELIPIIQPLLPNGGAVSGSNYELVIKTTPENFHQLERVIGQLDGRQPLISIAVRRIHNSAYDTYEASGGHVDVYATEPQKRQDQEQKIVVQNGKSAFIKTGESIPVRDRNWGLWGGYSHTRYKEVASGFYVTPRISGDNVILTIDWKHNQLQDDQTYRLRNRSSIDVEQSQTMITIPMGEWYDLSRVSTSPSETRNATVYDTASVKHPDTNVLVKVEIMSNEPQRVKYPQGEWMEYEK